MQLGVQGVRLQATLCSPGSGGWKAGQAAQARQQGPAGKRGHSRPCPPFFNSCPTHPAGNRSSRHARTANHPEQPLSTLAEISGSAGRNITAKEGPSDKKPRHFGEYTTALGRVVKSLGR